MIMQRIMQPSIACTSEHLDPWSSQQTYHRPNQPHKAFTPVARELMLNFPSRSNVFSLSLDQSPHLKWSSWSLMKFLRKGAKWSGQRANAQILVELRYRIWNKDSWIWIGSQESLKQIFGWHFGHMWRCPRNSY